MLSWMASREVTQGAILKTLRNVIQMAQLLTKFDTSKLHGVDGSPQPKQTSNKNLDVNNNKTWGAHTLLGPFVRFYFFVYLKYKMSDHVF